MIDANLSSGRPLSAALALAFTAGCAVAPRAADAAEWLLNPSANVAAEYSDNPRLLIDNPEEAAGWVGDLQLQLMRKTERTTAALKPRFQYARYTDNDAFDRNDGFLTLDVQHHRERSLWNGSAQFVRDTTLTSELETTGLVRANKVREGIYASGGTSMQLTDVLSMGTQVNWSDNHYVDSAFTGLIDYSYAALSVFGEMQQSDRTRWSLSASTSELMPEFGRPDTRDAAATLRWTFKPAELWNLELSAGPSWAESGESIESGEVYSISVDHRSEIAGWSLSAARQLTPTGLGVLARSDRAALSVHRRIGDRWSVFLANTAGRNRDVFSQGSGSLESRFARIEARSEWRLTPHVRLKLTLGVAAQESDAASSSAENYRVAVGVSWNGDTFSL